MAISASPSESAPGGAPPRPAYSRSAAIAWSAASNRRRSSGGIESAKIADWVAALGWEAVLNRRSKTWRTLPEATREIDAPAAAVDLMAAHPTLIKRPVLEIDGEATVGFGSAVMARLERGGAS